MQAIVFTILFKPFILIVETIRVDSFVHGSFKCCSHVQLQLCKYRSRVQQQQRTAATCFRHPHSNESRVSFICVFEVRVSAAFRRPSVPTHTVMDYIDLFGSSQILCYILQDNLFTNLGTYLPLESLNTLF